MTDDQQEIGLIIKCADNTKKRLRDLKSRTGIIGNHLGRGPTKAEAQSDRQDDDLRRATTVLTWPETWLTKVNPLHWKPETNAWPSRRYVSPHSSFAVALLANILGCSVRQKSKPPAFFVSHFFLFHPFARPFRSIPEVNPRLPRNQKIMQHRPFCLKSYTP